MADDQLPRLERERAEADRAYNDALTALDRSLVHVAPTAAVADAESIVPDLPAGLLGRWLRPVREWLAPSLRRQEANNARLVAAINAASAREGERAAAFEQFQSALIRFLQQITGFVETKERQVASAASAPLDALRDLQAQVAVLQRATQMLTRPPAVQPQQAAAQVSPPPANVVTIDRDDYKYVAFEDQFRGSIEEIRAKLAEYVPIFAGASDVLDVGCGRGEFLHALGRAGVRARGIDLNGEMIATARERGLDAEAADALAYLTSLPDESLGGLFAAQVIEHLQPPYLVRLLQTAFYKLRPGAPIVLETINPACWLAFFSSYLRDLTHAKPIHPDTLEYLLRASGFATVSIRYSAPVAEHVRMRCVELPAALADSTEPGAKAIADLARAVNENAAILNSLAFSNQDYAAIGYRS